MKRLGGKVAIITGGGRGIGRSVAKAYAEEGAKVVLVSRTLSDLQSVAGEINSHGGAALEVEGDVSNSKTADHTVQAAIREFGTVDILLNNAGIEGTSKALEEIKEEEWNEVLKINVGGTFLFSRAVLPLMLAKGGGNIINMSSGAGEKRTRKMVRSIPYAVSKFAIEGLTNALSVRLAGTGINVNALKPGPTRTSIQEGWTEEDFQKHEREVGPMHEPEFVNDVAIYLASLRPGQLTGQSLSAREWNQSMAKTH